MAFRMTSSGIPVGGYRAEFIACDLSTHDEYGPRCCWRWRVVDGDHKGAETTRYTSQKTGKGSALRKICDGLAGRKLEDGDDFDPADYIGRQYMVVVGETDSGATRVDHVMPATA